MRTSHATGRCLHRQAATQRNASASGSQDRREVGEATGRLARSAWSPARKGNSRSYGWRPYQFRLIRLAITFAIRTMRSERSWRWAWERQSRSVSRKNSRSVGVLAFCALSFVTIGGALIVHRNSTADAQWHRGPISVSKRANALTPTLDHRLSP
jgi:hypothetical protein